MPQFLRFIKEGYAKIVRSQGQKENQENHDTVPLSTQILVPTYTACLSIFKVMTTSISLKYKTILLVTIGLKSPKEGCTRTPETTHSLLMKINGQQCSFISDVDYKIKNINKKKELINRMLQNLKNIGTTTSMSDGTKRNYTPPAISEFRLQTFKVKK